GRDRVRDAMDISKLLTPERIRVPLASTSKTDAITALIDVLAATDGLLDRDAALAAVLRRENERSTGIGFGLAIPHGKSDGCRSLVMAAGKPAEGIDFQSADRRPVTFIVLLVSPPDQTGAHIQALAKISRLMNIEEFRKAIAAAGSAGELHAAIVAHEAHE
ncbi:MAG: PTS sugar transporter subunit IIA, partial [Phycisphaerae bacterium]